MKAHGGTPSRANRGVRCPTRPFVPPASIAGCDPARIVASRNPVVPASSNHLEVVVTVGAIGRGAEDRVGTSAVATNA